MQPNSVTTEATMDMSEAKKRARAATLGAPSSAFKTIGVQIGEAFFAIREPTVREHGEIMKIASAETINPEKPVIDLAKMKVAAVVKCAFAAEPELDEQGQPKTEQVPALDPRNQPILDADGKPKLEPRPLVKIVHDEKGRPERVYDDSDMDGLLDQPTSGVIEALAKPAMRLVNATMEDARKSG